MKMLYELNNITNKKIKIHYIYIYIHIGIYKQIYTLSYATLKSYFIFYKHYKLTDISRYIT